MPGGRETDLLRAGNGANKPYLLGAGAGKNTLKTAPMSREPMPRSQAFIESERVKKNLKNGSALQPCF